MNATITDMCPFLDRTLYLSGPFGMMHRASPSCTFFLPFEDAPYTPIIIHVNVHEVTLGAYGMVKELIESDCPPVVVFTKSNESKDIGEFIEYLESNDYTDSFNAIFSIANSSIPPNTYCSLHNNLPLDLEEYLMSFFEWTDYDEAVASHAAEILSVCLNIPCVSFHLGGLDQWDWDVLTSLIKYIPKYHEWKYAEYHYVEAKDNKRCMLCGKKRGPQKYFYKIQGNLCSVCEKKIKDYQGEVNVINLSYARYELNRERLTTRRANIKKHLCGVLLACPKCGGRLDYGREGDCLCSKCRTRYFKQQDTLIEAKASRMLYTYKKKKLIRIMPSSEQQLIQYCASCGSPTTKGHRYERVDGTYTILCDACNWNLQRTIKKRENKGG